MRRCAGCCLHISMRIVNIIVNLCGVAMIIYSLWLLKKWKEGIVELPSALAIPKPWFIYTSLSVGIAICLSTICGHMVANCISNSTLLIYILAICSLLFLEVVVIVCIFFKIDWGKKIAEYIDEHHQEFLSFVIFHLKVCRWIAVMISVLQINVLVLAVILWAIGTEPRADSYISAIPDFSRSFLVGSNMPVPDGSRQTCRECEVLHHGNPPESFLSYIRNVIRMQFQRRITMA